MSERTGRYVTSYRVFRFISFRFVRFVSCHLICLLRFVSSRCCLVLIYLFIHLGPLKPIVRRNRLAANYNNDSYNHENQYTSSSIIGMTGNNNTLRIPNKETQGDRPMGRPRASTTTKPTAQRKHEFATVRGSR